MESIAVERTLDGTAGIERIAIPERQRTTAGASVNNTNEGPHRISFLRAHLIASDPWRRAYAPLMAEFFASMIYTLFSNLLGVVGMDDSAAMLSIAIFDGGIVLALICMFGGISGAHFNPAITLATMLTLNMPLLIGFVILFIQFFGAFFGALITRATLSNSDFVDVFITLGIFGVAKLPPTSAPDYPTGAVSDTGDTPLLASGGSFATQIEAVQSTDFQLFLTETLLSSLIVTAYLFTANFETVLSTASSVAAVRSFASLLGAHFHMQVQHFGAQNANLARSLANCLIASIFSREQKIWRHFYISVFGALCSSVVSATVFWLIKNTFHEPPGVQSRTVVRTTSQGLSPRRSQLSAQQSNGQLQPH